MIWGLLPGAILQGASSFKLLTTYDSRHILFVEIIRPIGQFQVSQEPLVSLSRWVIFEVIDSDAGSDLDPDLTKSS